MNERKGGDENERPARRNDHQSVEKVGWTSERHEIIYQELRGQLDTQNNYAADLNDHAFQLLSIELALLAVIGTAIGSELIAVGSSAIVVGSGFFMLSMVVFVFSVGGLPKFVRARVGGRPVLWIGPSKDYIIYLIYNGDDEKSKGLPNESKRGQRQASDSQTRPAKTTWDEELLLSMAQGLEMNRRNLRNAAGTSGLGILFFVLALIVLLLDNIM